MNVQLVDELREIADWFRLRGLNENAALLDHAAHTVQCAANFFAWYNKYCPAPSSHPHHPWCVLGALLTSEKGKAESSAERMEKALKDIRSLSSINSAMNPSPLALTVLLGDIHHIADAVLSKEERQRESRGWPSTTTNHTAHEMN